MSKDDSGSAFFLPKTGVIGLKPHADSEYALPPRPIFSQIYLGGKTMNAEQLRDFLAEYIDYYFPDSPVYIDLNGRLYEIGLIYSKQTRIRLVPGEESELSRRVREELGIDDGPQTPE